MNTKKHFYTNGIKTIKLSDDDPIPEGFYKGRTFKANPWNKGLTKDDPRVVKYIRSGELSARYGKTSWNKGLTKETDDRLKACAEKISSSCKGRLAWNKGLKMSAESRLKLSQSMKGKVAWNKNLTKDTDERVMKISLHSKGKPCSVKDWKAAKLKEYNTKRRNGTFNSSKPENDLYDKLVAKYGVNNVIHTYRDDRYPFNCDFYIPSDDLFIEYQGTWLHGEHPFDKNNVNDVEMFDTWKNLAKSKNSNFYASAVYVWSDLDVRKLSIARNNKLNFQFIYPNGLIVDK